MKTIPATARIYLTPGATDMRKAIDGPSALVREVLGEDPLSGHLLVEGTPAWRSPHSRDGGGSAWPRPGESDRPFGLKGQSPVTESDLIHRAVLAFLEYGRGAVVVLLDEPEPIYVRADEAVSQLTEWRAEPEIIGAVAQATTDYDPEHEAVVVREDAISFTVSIERSGDSETVGSVTWAPVN